MRGMMLRYLMFWGIVILSVTAGLGMWQERGGNIAALRYINTETQTNDGGTITLNQRRDGHYYANLMINGRDIHFLVDTGATDLVLTKQDALRIGLDEDDMAFNRQASTANGTVKSATVRLDDVQFGPFSDQSVTASVNGGDMQTSLLGMTYLRRFDTIQISDGKMILER